MKSEDAILLGALGLFAFIAVTVLTKKPNTTPAAPAGPGGASSGPAGVGPNNVQMPTNMPSMSVDPLEEASLFYE